ncbi:hypothetical protein [Endozoicomonas arenosclerae]|uniref:hypothetical protein n=1 Tax=Endozoicomonas arenosclerae TaxID=1633495 RepID=UPI000AE5EA69|nr:hypothetical protein [Endozoicomonas arenosclerae]
MNSILRSVFFMAIVLQSTVSHSTAIYNFVDLKDKLLSGSSVNAVISTTGCKVIKQSSKSQQVRPVLFLNLNSDGWLFNKDKNSIEHIFFLKTQTYFSDTIPYTLTTQIAFSSKNTILLTFGGGKDSSFLSKLLMCALTTRKRLQACIGSMLCSKETKNDTLTPLKLLKA